MSLAGIRIKDWVSNTVVLEVTDRLTRLTGSSLSTGTVDGSYVIPQTDGNDLPWFYVLCPTNIGAGNQVPPIVTLTGWTLSWTWPPSSGTYTKIAAQICFGVY